MTISQYFPIYDQLDKADQERLDYAAVKRRVPKGTLLHGGDGVCTGLLVIASGQLRAHMISEEGREITLYRLFERDICLFSASCIMSSLQFDVFISAEKDTELWIIPPDFYKGLMERSAVVANYTSQIMASRFTDVMWLMDQVMWKSFDKRLAGFLLEESVLEGSVGIALLTTFPKYDELVYDLIQKENMVLLVNKACALAERIRPGTPIDIREAADEVFICSRQGHSARTILDALCAARNMKPEIGLETISIEVGKYVVATSPVVMACPDAYADTENSLLSPYYTSPSWEWKIPGIFLPATGRTCISQNICGIFWSCSTRSGTSPPAVTARRREQRPSPS